MTRNEAESTKRPKADWERAKALYRTGLNSNREIARQVGCAESALRKRALREGWQKDLADRVKKAIREKLVRSAVEEVRSVRESPALRTDDQTVDAAVLRPVQMVLAHQKMIGIGNHLIKRLFEQLGHAIENRESLEEAAHEEAGHGQGAAQRRQRLLTAVSLPKHASMLLDLSNCMKATQGLERIAYGIDDRDAAKENDLVASLRELNQQS